MLLQPEQASSAAATSRLCLDYTASIQTHVSACPLEHQQLLCAISTTHTGLKMILHCMLAATARGGLGALPAQEVIYFTATTDADGAPLNGNVPHTVTFPEHPPALAFWSLAIYNASSNLFFNNSIDRYSIGIGYVTLRSDAPCVCARSLGAVLRIDPVARSSMAYRTLDVAH